MPATATATYDAAMPLTTPMRQLDIFTDGRDVMLVNDLAAALSRDRLDAARTAAAALDSEFPGDVHLAPAGLLIAALAAREDAPFANAAAAIAAREALLTQLSPAAVAVLGQDEAQRWRAARLRELAARAARLPWRAEEPLAHAAPFLIAADAWEEALAALAGIEAWRRQPQPVAWAARATWRRDGSDAAWPLVAMLAWLAPAHAKALVAELADSRLSRMAARFEADLDGEDYRWFPAWLLVEQPLLAGPLESAQPQRDEPAERAFKTLQTLLRLERQGRHREIVEQRGRLQALNAALFACYMKTR